MNCSLHPDRPASAFCRNCGRALCAEDQREVYGVVFCQECLARQIGMAPNPAAGGGATGEPLTPPPPGTGGTTLSAPNPGVALGLGFIPGVGAIYNGQYFKAFLQVVIFGFLVYMSDAPFGPIFGIGAAAFYFYMVIDSFHTARAISIGHPVEDFPGMGQVRVTAPVGAIILIAIGAILLLRSFNFFAFDVMRYFWPVLLIVIGLVMLERRRDRA
ncbi:MAG: B-box zinc finger protein [Terriglobales bacterium]